MIFLEHVKYFDRIVFCNAIKHWNRLLNFVFCEIKVYSQFTGSQFHGLMYLFWCHVEGWSRKWRSTWIARYWRPTWFCRTSGELFNTFLPIVPKWGLGTLTKGFDARLANRPFLVFDFQALWRSGLSARVPESQKLKWSVSQHGVESLNYSVAILEHWAKVG